MIKVLAISPHLKFIESAINGYFYSRYYKNLGCIEFIDFLLNEKGR